MSVLLHLNDPSCWQNKKEQCMIGWEPTHPASNPEKPDKP